RHRITVETQLSEDLELVLGDRVQLQQVILNLLLNASEAMKFVDDRARRLLIDTRCHGDNVEFSVMDSGTGIAPDALAKLFTPFFTTKQEGMGIGLSVSRAIIERHGGRLWASNNEDYGATFRFSLPCNGETE